MPSPATARRKTASWSRPSGAPSIAASGPTSASPKSITHASSVVGPIILLARELHRVAVANASAAPKPPRMASMAFGYVCLSSTYAAPRMSSQ